MVNFAEAYLLPVQTLQFEDDGATPNSCLPVLIYRIQTPMTAASPAAFEALFARHRWTPLWRDGIFPYHHFHPNAHEALGICAGHAQVMLGGKGGLQLDLQAGDVVLLPAGTGHCCLTSSEDFLVVGAYPRGQEDYATSRSGKAAHAQALTRIPRVSTPAQNPLTGAAMTEWSGCSSVRRSR